MAAPENQADFTPHSPAPSVGSHKSMDTGIEADIKELLRNLPSKTDLTNMLGKLEATFQSKMEAMGSDINQVSLRVTDLEDRRDVLQAQMTNLSSTIETKSHFMSSMQRQMDDLDNQGLQK
ncbi:Hypothetical predicted protein [Pelobates cultripes]|uniref:Uncharacterized protein n=1 Tax=Pelobates cultripes TaxID=61616 RepID=A0AAD1RTN0_PELCU|nr:Hypothetical predicted protein [Pelobates cultripes]